MKIVPNKMRVRQFYYSPRWLTNKPYYMIFFPNGYTVASSQTLVDDMKKVWSRYYEA